MKSWLAHWIKTNSLLLLNAGSLVSTTVVTSVLGFAYWWVAARLFPPQAVGLSSAAISAMMLLGTLCTLGMGTLLVGEISRHPGREASLITAALILVLLVGGSAGLVFTIVSPFLSANFLPLRATIGAALLFALGVGLTSVTLVLDQALIGLLQGRIQLWRNTLFSILKLAALFLPALLLVRDGLTIYATWVGGSAVSVAALAGFALVKRGLHRSYLPHWGLLRRLGPTALQHYTLNMLLQAPGQILPVLVTALLSATMNAWFYISDMLANFVYMIPISLTTVLFAASSALASSLSQKMRLTLGVAFAGCAGANIVLLIGAPQILALFGHTYAVEAAWCLRILGLAAFPLIIKNHYIALLRIRGAMARAILPLTGCGVLELLASALGARLGGLTGLSLGWLIAICIEALFMSPAIYKAARTPGEEDNKEPLREAMQAALARNEER